MNKKTTGIIAVIGLLLLAAYFGGLFPLTIAGGAGWYADRVIWQYDETINGGIIDVCYNTPIDVAVPFQRLSLSDAEFTGTQSYTAFQNTGSAGWNRKLGADGSLLILKGNAEFSPAGTDPFQNPVGSMSVWNLTFTMPSDVRSTGVCEPAYSDKCVMYIGICASDGIQTENGNPYCAGKAGTERAGEFKGGSRGYAFHDAAFFGSRGCPESRIAAVIPVIDGPVPEFIEQVISPSSPAQKTTTPTWVWLIIVGGVAVIAWKLIRK